VHLSNLPQKENTILTDSTTTKAKWIFAPRGGGQIQGFNVAGLEWFAEDPIGKVVREICQNSIDAVLHKDRPVRVAIDFSEKATSDVFQLAGLAPYISAAEEAARIQNSAEPSLFWEEAGALLAKSKINVISFHDFNTKGLTGPVENEIANAGTPWIGLVMASGVNATTDDAAGGAFGIGKSAPFVLSKLRTVFYYTLESEFEQERFIGTSILQTLDIPELDPSQKSRQNVGHFGMTSGEAFESPLVDSEVPGWVRADRNKYESGTGTSVMIPGIDSGMTSENFYDNVVIAAVGNLYASIKFGKLEITLGGSSRPKLDAESIDNYLDQVRAGKFGAPSDAVLDNLESALTIRDGTRHDLHVPTFGDLVLFLRTGEGIVQQSIGLARNNGQLITRRMPKLANFGAMGVQPFDLFVYAESEGTGMVFRAFEPPSHDSLVLERADRYKSRYDKFVEGIRKFLRENVAIAVSGKRKTGALNDIFGLANFGADVVGQVNETVRKIAVSKGTKTKSRLIWGSTGGKPKRRPGGTGTGTGTGKRIQSFPRANFGEEIPIGNFNDDPTLQFRVTNLGVHKKSGSLKGKAWFNVQADAESLHLSVYQVGDSVNSTIPIKLEEDDEWSWSIEVSPKGSSRRSIELFFGAPRLLGSTVACSLTTTKLFDSSQVEAK